MSYFEALGEYAVKGNFKPFADMVSDLEEMQLNDYISILLKEEE